MKKPTVANVAATKLKKVKTKSASGVGEKGNKEAGSSEDSAIAKVKSFACDLANVFRNRFNQDYVTSYDSALRPFRPGLVCPGCELPIDDSSSETVFALAGSPYRTALAKAKGLDEEQPIFIHKGCLICYCVVDPNTGTPCREADLAFNATFAPQNRINLNRHGLPLCYRHADDHALAVPTFAQSDVQAQKNFLDRYGFVKIVPDDNFPTEARWAEEHERVLHGFAATHGIPFDEFKKRADRENWAASDLDDELFQESCMFGIFGTQGSGNELKAPFVQSQEAYAVRGKYLEAFANLLRIPDRLHKQTFSSDPCPYILIAKGATNEFPVYLSPDTKCDSKDRANPLLIMTGFTFFEETSRLLGGLSVAIGSVRVTKSNKVPFPQLLKTAFPRAQSQGHFKEDNPFVGAMVAIPTRPGEAILIRSGHPYCFFSGGSNHTGMILAASDMTPEGDALRLRAKSVLDGTVLQGVTNRVIIKYNGKLPHAPINFPMRLRGVFTPIVSLAECAEDVFGLGKTDPSTWPPEFRPQPVPRKVEAPSKMVGSVRYSDDDDDDEIIPEPPKDKSKKKMVARKKTKKREEPEEEEEVKEKKKAKASAKKMASPKPDKEEKEEQNEKDKELESKTLKNRASVVAKKAKLDSGDSNALVGSPEAHEPRGTTFRSDKMNAHLKKGEVKSMQFAEEEDEEEAEDDDEEEENEEGGTVWRKGNQVCACLTDIPGFKDYKYCHMDGVIDSVANDKAVVKLTQLGKSVQVTLDQLERVRKANEGGQWRKGQRVQVLQTLDSVDGWWDAFIVKQVKPTRWKVKWVGKYEGFSDEVVVGARMLRDGKE